MTRLPAIACVCLLAACGPRAPAPVNRAILGRCMVLGGHGPYTAGGDGPYTVLVHRGDQVLWRGEGNAGQTVDIPADVLAGADGQVEVVTVAGKVPPGGIVPICGEGENCTPQPCPPPPGNPPIDVIKR